ncbi:MAG: RNA 3'-terminal phosphate cyclase [Candidatus Sumerlaeia bacterium]
MITIDGSRGEGGGQILRTALALSLVTGRPFRIENIRAGRRKPGLMRQHLTAVSAAAQIGHAEFKGGEIGSMRLAFAPRPAEAGHYHFAVGTAGSTTLVLQTVLPALMLADGPSELVLEGGTHNPMAPPFDFLERAFLPLLGKIGPNVTATLDRPGFYPAGGGQVTVRIEPAKALRKLELLERGHVVSRTARAAVANLDPKIAERELKVVGEKLGWPKESLKVAQLRDSHGPGNALTIEIESEAVTEVFTGFGERGVTAETVAERVVGEAKEYIEADGIPVGRHLADQLLIPMALAGGGKFRTLEPTPHTQTNAEVIREFIDVEIRMSEQAKDDWAIEIG